MVEKVFHEMMDTLLSWEKEKWKERKNTIFIIGSQKVDEATPMIQIVKCLESLHMMPFILCLPMRYSQSR